MSLEFSRTESQILDALSLLDEFLLITHTRVQSRPVTKRSGISRRESQGANKDHSQKDPPSQAKASLIRFSHDLVPEETYNSDGIKLSPKNSFYLVYVRSLFRAWVNIVVGPTARELHFGIGFVLETILNWFPVLHVIVPECSRNGSRERSYLWVQDQLV